MTRGGGHGMTRMITEGGRGWGAAGVSRKGAKFAKGMARVGDLTEARRVCVGGAHEMAEWHEMGLGRARAQRSGARNRNRCARCGAVGMARGG